MLIHKVTGWPRSDVKLSSDLTILRSVEGQNHLTRKISKDRSSCWDVRRVMKRWEAESSFRGFKPVLQPLGPQTALFSWISDSHESLIHENHESVISPGSCEPHKITPSVHGVMMHDCPQWGMHGESCSLHPPSVLRLFYFVCESTDRRAAVTVQLESLWFCFGALLHPVPLWWFVQICLTRGHSAWLSLLRFGDHRPESVTVQSVGNLSVSEDLSMSPFIGTTVEFTHFWIFWMLLLSFNNVFFLYVMAILIWVSQICNYLWLFLWFPELFWLIWFILIIIVIILNCYLVRSLCSLYCYV